MPNFLRVASPTRLSQSNRMDMAYNAVNSPYGYNPYSRERDNRVMQGSSLNRFAPRISMGRRRQQQQQSQMQPDLFDPAMGLNRSRYNPVIGTR